MTPRFLPATLIAACLLALPGFARGDEPSSAPPSELQPAAETSPGEVQLISGTEAVVPASGEKPAEPAAQQLPSDAERIARLERSIDADEKRRQAVKESLHSTDGEYEQAEANFRELDAERTARQQRLAEAGQQGAATEEELKRLQDDLAALEKKWALAKERFDLEISERKAAQESLVTIDQKLQNNRDTLAKLRGTGDAPQPIPQPSQPPANVSTAPPVTTPQAPAAPVAPAPQPPATAAPPAIAVPTPMSVLAPQETAVPPASESPAPTQQPAGRAVSERVAAELAAARAKAQQSTDAALAAEAEAQAITERIEILQKDIEQQRQLRDTARRKVDNADETLKNLNEELFRKLMSGEDISSLKQQIRDTSGRMLESRKTSREIATHLDDLQSTLALLQSEKMTASKNADLAAEAAAAEQANLAHLENPFTLRNVQQWLIDHGPRILIILASLTLLMWCSRVCETRLVALISRRGRRGSREDRENRAKTLLSVFNNVANLLILGGAVVMLLDEIGIPVTPVIGGAAVLGLAVAFGAQSLIKDYFTGFMVLFEQQYLINDVVRIGDITGQVERISLRMTVLRDLEGRVHFIPHGQIDTVTNLTHGWSRAVFEIGVAYKESVDQVIAVLQKLADELRQDDNYRFLILDTPVMLGVDSLANSAVIIKFYIQTRPLQQWTVKREMLRRIKNEFDRLGIEIPFPHVTVYQGSAKPAESSGDDHWTRRDVA